MIRPRNWEDEPTYIRRRDLRTDKYEKEREMNRARTNEMRKKPMGTNGVCDPGTGPSVGTAKQHMHSGPKYTGPNYAQKSKTGPLQNGGTGGKGAK